MIQKAIFESPTVRDKGLILSYLKNGSEIYILEPFHAYHHRGAIRFYPPPLPDYIKDLVEKKRLRLITAEQINSRDLYAEAADRAVDSIEKVYPFYREAVSRVIRFVSDEIGAGVESAFKKNLCDRLGDFFSLNMLIGRIGKIFETTSVELFPSTDTIAYEFFLELIEKSGCDYIDCKNVIVPRIARKRDRVKKALLRINMISKLILQTVGSIAVALLQKEKSSKKAIKKYRFGISIIAPRRQFRGNQRGVDFIVDNKKIHPKDVIYIPLVDLDEYQKRCLAGTGSDTAYLPRIGRFFTNWSAWAHLAILSAQKEAGLNCDLIEVAAVSLFTFYRWKYVLKDVQIDHFITHSDFSNSHIARNLLLRQKGTTTWYFTESSNSGNCFRKNNGSWNRHPFWSFQNYDNLLTWNEDLAEFFHKHPESYRNVNVIGSLWSSHVNSSIDRQAFLMQYFNEGGINDKFVIVAFASTYTVNGSTSYQEGIDFARHLEKLAEEFSDVLILLKDKKESSFHKRLDPELGTELLKLYERMNCHQRIKICSNKIDTSAAMAVCDLCISFPYTSTTNEAIGFRIPAIWHDPHENYRNTPYAKHGNLVTHGYAELRKKVIDFKSTISGEYVDPIKEQSSLFDPYRDGKAIDRFRDLLCKDNDK